MPKYEGHLKNYVFIEAFWSLKQFRIHNREITVVLNITVANTITHHKPRPLSPFIISEQDGVKRKRLTEEMQTVRMKASLFTLRHHPHRSPSLGTAVNIRLFLFQQLSPISISTRVCVCSVPLRVSHPVRSAAI